MPTFKILAIDGGGIGGLIPAILLERLDNDKDLPGFLDSVDLFAGTSTGGLIALGLAYGLSPTKLKELYTKQGEKIFQRSWWQKFPMSLFWAKYSNHFLSTQLNELFGSRTLGELKKKVVIPTFDLEKDIKSPSAFHKAWRPKIFHNCKEIKFKLTEQSL
jgi:patatin-like phospholipase/acyl hydrolase